ncbi:MAG: hypothetical protein GY870_16585 [archaeon]|nr:hypothetical protein [archaeon]
MWEKLIEQTDGLATSGDPAPKTPQNPVPTAFPKNVAAKKSGPKAKIVKKDPDGASANSSETGALGNEGTPTSNAAVTEGSGPGQTEDKHPGQVAFEKKYFVTKKKPEAYEGQSELSVGTKASTPSNDTVKAGKYVAFGKHPEPTKGNVKKIAECINGGAVVLAALTLQEDDEENEEVEETITVGGTPIRNIDDVKTKYNEHMKTAPMGPSPEELKSYAKHKAVQAVTAVNRAKEYYNPNQPGGKFIQKGIGAGHNLVKSLANR